MAKPKIVIGEPYRRQNAIMIPIRYNFPDGSSEEETVNWNLEKDPDEIERDAKRYYIEKWERRQRFVDADALLKRFDKVKHKKIMTVTLFDDESELPDVPI